MSDIVLGETYVDTVHGITVVATEVITRLHGNQMVRCEWSVGGIINATYNAAAQLERVGGPNEK